MPIGAKFRQNSKNKSWFLGNLSIKNCELNAKFENCIFKDNHTVHWYLVVDMLRQETGIGMCFVQLVLGLIDSTWEIGSQYILTHFGATVKRVVFAKLGEILEMGARITWLELLVPFLQFVCDTSIFCRWTETCIGIVWTIHAQVREGSKIRP